MLCSKHNLSCLVKFSNLLRPFRQSKTQNYQCYLGQWDFELCYNALLCLCKNRVLLKKTQRAFQRGRSKLYSCQSELRQTRRCSTEGRASWSSTIAKNHPGSSGRAPKDFPKLSNFFYFAIAKHFGHVFFDIPSPPPGGGGWHAFIIGISQANCFFFFARNGGEAPTLFAFGIVTK